MESERVSLTINGQMRLSLARGKSVFAALNEAGVFLPTACGGRGGCGLCKLRVTRGTLPEPTRSEIRWLTES